MIGKKWQRKTERWWIAQRVLTMENIGNGFLVVPAGTVCTVTRKYGGLNLQSEPCEKCGVKVCISKVRYRKLTLIDEIVVLCKETANLRAVMEASPGSPMAVLEWDGRYLVVPEPVANKSPLPVVFRIWHPQDEEA